MRMIATSISLLLVAIGIDLPPGEQVGPRPPDHVVVQADQPKLRETDWSKRIAADFRAQGTPAETEFVCPDGSRVDILLPEYAVEVDYGHNGKWKEAVGQAVFYGVVTNRKPMVVLLMSKEYDRIDYLRCAVACAKIGVDIRIYKID